MEIPEINRQKPKQKTSQGGGLCFGSPCILTPDRSGKMIRTRISPTSEASNTVFERHQQFME
ncbi:MAG: hypothetical protein KBF98_06650, partial [Rhodoferax sp.]|nr:hypothetical protein [Rhodoferax sp.]